MKVLVCIPCLLVGGTEVQTLNLVRALVAAGHEVCTVAYFEYNSAMVEQYRSAGSRVVLLSPDGKRVGGKGVVPFLWKGLRRVVKDFRPDIVHVQYMAPGAIPVLLLRLMGIKNIIATAHTMADIYPSLRLVHFIQRHCVRAFTCITERAEKSFFGSSQIYTTETKIGKRNHFTIYNCLPQHIHVRDDERYEIRDTRYETIVSGEESTTDYSDYNDLGSQSLAGGKSTTHCTDYTDCCSPSLAGEDLTTEDTKDTEGHRDALRNSVLSEYSVVEKQTTDYPDCTDLGSPSLAGEDLTTEDTKDTKEHKDLRDTSVLSEYSVVKNKTTDYTDYTDYCSPSLAGEKQTTEDTKDTKEHKNLRAPSVLSESSVVEIEPQRTQGTQSYTENPGGEDLTTEDTKDTEKHKEDLCDTSVLSEYSVVDNKPQRTQGTQSYTEDPRGEVTIGVVSRLEEIKGMDLVVPAFVKVHEHFPQTRLLVVGDGSLRQQMEEQVAQGGIADSVTFAGRVEGAELQKWYDKIDILLMPSRSEGFGLTAIEGMARGCVVVASDTGGLPEVVTPEVGLLHKSAEVDDMAEKITSLIEHPDKMVRMSTNALQAVRKYTFDAYSKAFSSLYSRLMS